MNAIRYTPDPETGILAPYTRAACWLAAASMAPSAAQQWLATVTPPTWMRDVPVSYKPAAIAAWAAREMPEGTLVALAGYLASRGVMPTSARRCLAIDAAIEGSRGRLDANGVHGWVTMPGGLFTVIDMQGRVRACEGRGREALLGNGDLFGRGIDDLAAALGSSALPYAIERATDDRDREVMESGWRHLVRRVHAGVVVMSEAL